MSRFGLHSTRETWTYGSKPSGGHQHEYGAGARAVQGKAERAGFPQPGEEKTSKSYGCVQLPREDGARLFLEVYSEMTKGSRQIGTREVLITYKDCLFFFSSNRKYDQIL